MDLIPTSVKQNPNTNDKVETAQTTMVSDHDDKSDTTTTDLSSLLDWSCIPGTRLALLDDGHCPEGLGAKVGQVAVYEHEAPPAVYVSDQAVDPDICQAWYQTMCQDTVDGRAAWGTHVTMDEIYQHWARPVKELLPSMNLQAYRRALAVAVAATFVQQAWQIEAGTRQPNLVYTIENGKIATQECTETKNMQQSPPLLAADMPHWWQKRQAHGVAVWALGAPKGAAVPYHVDYAEQVRYATNIIATPLQGGILHCTPGELQGGDYQVYLQNTASASLQHYQQHGYKSQRQAVDPQDPCRITIPYRTNRLILQAGYLPHGSTAVSDLGQAKCRVVVGLNVFGADVGKAVDLYPEHAPRFNAWVRRLRLQRGSNSKPQISLRSLIQKHPQKARQWYVNHRKAKFQAMVQELQASIYQMLETAGDGGLSVSALQSTLSLHDGRYPSPDDIWVFVSHRTCGPGALYQILGKEEEKLYSPDQSIVLRNPSNDVE